MNNDTIRWSVVVNDDGTVIAKTRFGFVMVYLIYNATRIYYRLNPFVSDHKVLGDDGYLLLRQLPRMSLDSALMEVEKKIRNSACITDGDHVDDVILWNGPNVISKIEMSYSETIFDIDYKGDHRTVEVRRVLVNWRTPTPDSPPSPEDPPKLGHKVSVDGGEWVTAKTHYLPRYHG